MSLSFVVIDDFDIVRIALPELETYPPRPVYGHRPLTLPVALELVDSHALERTKIPKHLGDVQRQEQVDSAVDLQPAELVRPLAFPDLAACRIAP